MNKSHVEKIKYLINKISLTNESTSRYTMFDVFYTLSLTFNKCNSDVVKMPQIAGHGGKKRFGGYIPIRLSLVIAKAILIGNCLLHSLKGMVVSDGLNYMLGTRMVCIEPLTSADVQYLCCHHRRPKEAKAYAMPKLRVKATIGINENKQELQHGNPQAF